MASLERWKIVDRFTIYQIALLVEGYDPADFEDGNTGCPRCGGWTWIAELVPAADPGGDWLARPGVVALPLTDTPRHRSAVCPDPTATPRRPAAGSGSPTTSQ